MKRFCGSAGRPDDDSEDCSAGQPAQQHDHYVSIYASKLCAVCKQACRYPFGPVRWPEDQVLVPTCGQTCYKKRWRLQGITIGDDGYKDVGSSAVRPAVAVRNSSTHISSSDVKNTMVGDALMLHDIFLSFSQSMFPQCLLRLSAGSRTLHRYATCDDVWKQFVEAQWPGGRVLCQHNILDHSFLHAFRNHRTLLSLDPATQRGSLPTVLSKWLPDVEQEYWMLVELRYCDPNDIASNTAPLVISPPLSIARRRSLQPVDCLTSSLEPGQKIRIPLEGNFNPEYFSFAVTIVRKRDAKCKRIFQFPSPSESFFDFGDNALLFDCGRASDIALRERALYLQAFLSRFPVLGIDPAPGSHLGWVPGIDPALILQNRIRVPPGLDVQLGIRPGTDAYQAECVEIYSYGDDGELLEDGIRESLLRIEHGGKWF